MDKGSPDPAAGQFYMLHAVNSSSLLGRPISVYYSEKKKDGSVEIYFLILVKGDGTKILCSLKNDDKTPMYISSNSEKKMNILFEELDNE